jgi:hypothetical protein
MRTRRAPLVQSRHTPSRSGKFKKRETRKTMKPYRFIHLLFIHSVHPCRLTPITLPFD